MIINRISITVTDAKKTKFRELNAQLAGEGEELQTPISKEELKSLPKMADGSIPFVEKVAQYAVSNPEFLPPYANVEEFNKDFKTFMDVREILRPFLQTLEKLDTTMVVAGSEAWDFARDYYKMVKHAASMGVPGAQAIYEDLRPRFERSSRKNSSNESKS